MSMAQFAQIKALEVQLDVLRHQLADALLRIQALEQKRTLELPKGNKAA